VIVTDPEVRVHIGYTLLKDKGKGIKDENGQMPCSSLLKDKGKGPGEG
jgi:hypothetical protein